MHMTKSAKDPLIALHTRVLLCSEISFNRQFHQTQKQQAKDYYKILGVSSDASAKAIKSAYYDKAKAYHPDALKQPQSTEVNAKFQEISEAYEILGDEQKRRMYDASIGRGSIRQDAHGHNGQARNRDAPYRPRERASEPINIKHIQHVYKALNKLEPEEVPEFKPFADHNYPNSSFNRFEYSRHYDASRKCWVYVERRSASKYRKDMERKTKNLWLTLMGLGAGTIALSFYFRQIRPSTRTEDSVKREIREYMERADKEAIKLRTIKFDD